MSKIYTSFLNIGETVKQLRQQKGLTQTDLAKKTGIARSHICKIEAGGNVSYKTIEKLAAGLNISIDKLTGTEKKFAKQSNFVEIAVSDIILESAESVLKFKSTKSNEKAYIDLNTWDLIKKKVKKPELIYAYIYPYDDLSPKIEKNETLFIKVVNAKINYNYGENTIKGAKKYDGSFVAIRLKNRKKLIRAFNYPMHFNSFNPDYEEDPGFIEGEDVDSIIGICVFSIRKTLWI